ncbi:MAG: HAMP domain-containing sensor histidine kinase [Lacipirellulaceae bacterium]
MNADEKEFERQLEQAKLDAMKELAYGASHEINNPLANISARAQALLRDETDPDKRRTLEAINQQALRAHEMISDLMLFARPPALVYEVFDVSEMLEGAYAESQEVCGERGIEITIKDIAEPFALNADRSQLTVAISALVRNAIEAIGTDGNVTVSAEQADGSARITVTDDGPGIPADVRKHLFEPFYSGREAGRGLGFGLSKCWRIVTEHGGTVEVESPEIGGGTSFTVRLPDNPKS